MSQIICEKQEKQLQQQQENTEGAVVRKAIAPHYIYIVRENHRQWSQSESGLFTDCNSNSILITASDSTTVRKNSRATVIQE